MTVHRLDARDLRCPLPVLRARKALAALALGDVLEVEATDPGAVRDFPAFCASAGHCLLMADVTDGVYRFRIEKRG